MSEKIHEVAGRWTIDVLVVVDALGAAVQGLHDNVYMIDSQKYCGSYNQGQAELVTSCVPWQRINWHLITVSPSNDAKIAGFTGQMVDQKICTPKERGTPSNKYWNGQVPPRAAKGKYQYSIVVNIDGKDYSFDPFIDVK